MRNLVTVCILVVVFTISLVSADYDDYVQKVRKESQGKSSVGAGDKVAHYTQGLKYPEESSTMYYDNDIRCPKSYTKSWKWPNGKVYYIYSSSLSTGEKQKIKQAIDSIMSKTNKVQFIARTNQNDYIKFDNEQTGCWSALGRVGGQQIVNLQFPESYHDSRTVQHLIFHALGVAHEHNRKDRDNVITIREGNIIQMYERNFEKDKDHKYSTIYDPFSIMHFTAQTNSDNGFYTIYPKDPNNIPVWQIGRSASATPADILKLEEIYH